MAAGEFADLDPELTGLAALSLMNWTYQWFDRSGPLSAAEVADRFHALPLGGIAARAVDHPAGLPSGG